MWPDKTVPVAEAEIDFKYDWAICCEGDRMVSHGPSVTYKGNGIGWSYNNPDNVIENIIELKRPMKKSIVNLFMKKTKTKELIN